MRRNNATGQAQPWLILESLCHCGYFPRADRRQWSGAGGPGREEMFPSAERQSCRWTGIGSRRNERSIRCQVEVAQRDFNPMSDRTNGDIPTPSLSVELSGPGKDVLDGLFTRKALSCGAVHFERVGWSTEVAELPPVGETIASTTRLWGETRLVSRPGAVVLMSFHSPVSSGRHGFDAFLAAADRLTLDNLSADLLDLLPEAPPRRGLQDPRTDLDQRPVQADAPSGDPRGPRGGAGDLRQALQRGGRRVAALARCRRSTERGDDAGRVVCGGGRAKE